MGSVRHNIGLAAAAIGLSAYAGLAVRVWQAQVDPERFVGSGTAPGALGPRPAALDGAADARISRALDVLNDTSRPPAERLAAYHRELAAAESLLVASLRAQPAQAYALAKLASVRWELSPALTDAEAAAYLEAIRVASDMAPRVAAVQRSLGELLLRMGRRQDAIVYLARAVKLEPDRSDVVVDAMRAQLMSAEEILAALPRAPGPLGALYQAFREEGGLGLYADAVDPLLGEATPRLLAVYGAARLATGGAAVLRHRLEALAYPASPELEAERARQLSRASLALGEVARAVDEARRAVALVPANAGNLEHLGDVLVRAGDGGGAVVQYQAGLARVARGSGDAATRARLYRKIGQAEEARGRPDVALDAYRRALELEPDEPVAADRLRDLTGR